MIGLSGMRANPRIGRQLLGESELVIQISTAQGHAKLQDQRNIAESVNPR